MTDDDRIDELLARWQENASRGHPQAATELCRDCPALAIELQRRIDVLEHMNRLVSVGQEYRVVNDINNGAEREQSPQTIPDGSHLVGSSSVLQTASDSPIKPELSS